MAAEVLLTSAAVALQAWTLKEVVAMKTKIAGLPCRPETPGECPEKKTKSAMRKYLTLGSVLTLTVLLALLLSGCTTPGPAGGPAFVADAAAISNNVAAAQGVIHATAPFNPYSGLLEVVAGLVGAVVTGASIIIAKAKSAKAAASEAAAATLAKGVVKAGATVAVLDHASNTPEYATVAERLNDATPD